MPPKALRTILRGLLGVDPKITLKLNSLATKYLAATRPAIIPQLFTLSGNIPAATASLVEIQQKCRCLMGCGIGFEGMILITEVVNQFRGLELDGKMDKLEGFSVISSQANNPGAIAKATSMPDDAVTSFEQFQLGKTSVLRMFMGLCQFSSPAWGTASKSKINNHFKKHVDAGSHVRTIQILASRLIKITEEVVKLHWKFCDDPQYTRMAQLVEQDPRVLNVGLCNFDTKRMNEIVEGGIKIGSNQVQGEGDLFQQLLITLWIIGKKHNVSISNVATRWVLDHDYVGAVIIGGRMGISEHVYENLKVFSFHLDEEDKASIIEILDQSNELSVYYVQSLGAKFIRHQPPPCDDGQGGAMSRQSSITSGFKTIPRYLQTKHPSTFHFPNPTNKTTQIKTHNRKYEASLHRRKYDLIWELRGRQEQADRYLPPKQIIKNESKPSHELCAEKDLSPYSRFTRNKYAYSQFPSLSLAYFRAIKRASKRVSEKDGYTYNCKTVAERTKPGQRQDVEEQDYTFHAYGRTEGICGIIISDHSYPALVAHQLLSKVVDEFLAAHPRSSWANSNPTLPFPELKDYIVKYQDPAQADSIMRIQKELDETKIVLHKTIESVLQRGEKIDDLVAKSDGLSAQSKMFYTQAKKQNSCCVVM
ncbi:hypothetical protein G7Y89_g1113 [Cudoniella acicularis]|uniref:Synaptobrevin homolog YKT6 n=1 Tax=Cudoniella acicularis TaxID=354080 RepID=A0A8H4WAL1_9HELO|nr:hypothetical protein G7Y89_g1113 [Cudoniella acicularis]